MSKLGKIDITIPDGVNVALNEGVVDIKGPIGSTKIDLNTDMFELIVKENKNISLKPKKMNREVKRLWGMKRSLINNAVIGVKSGYEKVLELVGVGYRAALKGNQLNLQLDIVMILILIFQKELKLLLKNKQPLRLPVRINN